MSTPNMNDVELRAAALAGSIDNLYTEIQANPHVLERIDSIPFVDTPLHVAASIGHLQFATEIVRLKPSFAWKLNPQGFTPIHLALQHGHKTMVLRLVDINKELIRAKGREGLTPLHFVSQVGDIDLLVEFLLLCPNSIQDVTVRSETALHIALKNQRYEALQVLLGWLRITAQEGAMWLERKVPSWKDEEGNTILHISALTNNLQAVRWLVKTEIDLEAKNLENKTSLDIAASEEIKSILKSAGAKRSSSLSDAPTFADKLKSKLSIMDKIIKYFRRIRSDITEDERNAFLIVATLVATATYQSALSPPGGVYQVNAGDNNSNTTSSLNSMATATPENAGTTVMPGLFFLVFSIFNALSFLVSIMTISVLIPSGMVRAILFGPMFLFINSYIWSLLVISPELTFSFYFILWVFLNLLMLLVINIFQRTYSRLWVPAYRKIETRNIAGENIW